MKMTERARTALEESIEKWRQIERGEMADLGIENCSLCMEYWGARCEGCPVFASAASRRFCYGTPYSTWTNAQRTLGRKFYDAEYVADTPELVKLARAERKFLESLR